MNIVTKLSDWLVIRKQLSGSIGFIPTMGNLHAGHLQLFERARCENDMVVASIFVNPTQFNQSSDYDTYPRTLQADYAKLENQRVDYVFVPDAKDMYPDNYEIRLTENQISRYCEGEYRPGHFDGMLTVVMKLLNLVKPMKAYFGIKDYQQVMLVKKMVSAFFMPIEIVSCETVRAEDGLALSSRNTRLTVVQRQHAAIFPKLLQSSFSLDEIKKQLAEHGFKIDYIEEHWQRRLGAVWLGEVRLIDNVAIKVGNRTC